MSTQYPIPTVIYRQGTIIRIGLVGDFFPCRPNGDGTYTPLWCCRSLAEAQDYLDAYLLEVPA